MNIPKLNVTNIVPPNIPGFRNNAHPSSARGGNAARNSYFGLDKGYQTEGRSQTERMAREKHLKTLTLIIADMLIDMNLVVHLRLELGLV